MLLWVWTLGLAFGGFTLCKHVTLAISMLKNIFPWHTKTQDYDLKYANVLL
jgi:hypothetical protein